MLQLRQFSSPLAPPDSIPEYPPKCKIQSSKFTPSKTATARKTTFPSHVGQKKNPTDDDDSNRLFNLSVRFPSQSSVLSSQETVFCCLLPLPSTRNAPSKSDYSISITATLNGASSRVTACRKEPSLSFFFVRSSSLTSLKLLQTDGTKRFLGKFIFEDFLERCSNVSCGINAHEFN